MSLREARIAAIEARYAITLPEDFRCYLARDCPEEDRIDGNNTTWWRLDRIRSLPEEYPHAVTGELAWCAADKYLVFADYMIWSWAWAVNCGYDELRGKVAIIAGNPDRFVAGSFRDFLHVYSEGPVGVF